MIQIDEIEKLFANLEPFNLLSYADKRALGEAMDIEYHKDGTKLYQLKEGEFPSFYIIIKGIVSEINQDNEVVKVYLQNDYFDAKSIIENRIKNSFIVEEELIAYTIPRDIFLHVVYKNEVLENYFFRSISQKLNEQANHDQAKDLANFMFARVSEAYIRKPLIAQSDISIIEAVEKMYEGGFSNIVVKKGSEVGIVTDTDFRFKVILKKLPYETQIDAITNYNLITIDSDDYIFNAQFLMTKHKIKRVIVMEGEEVLGVLDQIALNSFLSSHVYSVSNEIDNAKTVDDLKEAGKKTLKVIDSLFSKGVKVGYISELISEFNEKIFTKLFDMIASNEIKNDCALLIMGSEGRGEQIIKTDQDNALIIRDNAQIDKKVLAEFIDNFTTTLEALGYPKCSGNIMISNPQWAKRYSEFKKDIYNWIDKPNGLNLMNFSIFYDAKCVAGDEKLLEGIQDEIKKHVDKNLHFFSNFAAASLSFETPIGLFTSFKLDKEHKNQVDIKKGGIFAIVHGVRTMALENKIQSKNTANRILDLKQKGIFEDAFANELVEAFNYLSTLRLKSSLEKFKKYGESDNFIDPMNLSKIDKDLLHDSFTIVNNFKKYLSYKYKLG